MKNSIAAVLNSEDHYSACLENENDIHFPLGLTISLLSNSLVYFTKLKKKKVSFVILVLSGQMLQL